MQITLSTLKKAIFILVIFAVSITATSFAPAKKALGISLIVTANGDGTHTVSWDGQAEPVHTVTVAFHYGKKLLLGSFAYGIYKWSYDNPNNGEPKLRGSEIVNLFAYEPTAQFVTVTAYVCEYAYEGSPYDQYNCSNVVSVLVKRK